MKATIAERFRRLEAKKARRAVRVMHRKAAWKRWCNSRGGTKIGPVVTPEAKAEHEQAIVAPVRPPRPMSKVARFFTRFVRGTGSR